MAKRVPEKISIISDGNVVAGLNIPSSAKLKVSANKLTNSDDETKMHLKGGAKVALTLASGEVININAEEIDVISKTEKEMKSER
jgi:predicted ABC-type transport system involved in lysophospholipase L1 biosynthesis ATPase subunit